MGAVPTGITTGSVPRITGTGCVPGRATTTELLEYGAPLRKDNADAELKSVRHAAFVDDRHAIVDEKKLLYKISINNI